MKVLLRDDIDKLGALGEIVEVSAGFARNYLLPRNLAVRASAENEVLIQRIRKQRRTLELKRIEGLKEKALALDGKSITIGAKVSEERKLYGSVDAIQIAETVTRDLNFEVDPKQVVIEDTFKELGTYDVILKLHPEVTTTIKLWVVEE
jgi:large subunit ribosomal protein L9